MLVAVTFCTYVALELTPGDTARTVAGPFASAQRIEDVRVRLGLDKPLLVRYLSWLGRLARGDLGQSLATGQPIRTILAARFSVTLSLVLVAALWASAAALAFGLLAARTRSAPLSGFISVLCGLGLAVPPFWLGIMLVSLFAVRYEIFPSVGYVPLRTSVVGWFTHLVLPAATLGTFVFADLTLQLRNSMRRVLERPYMLAAQGRGYSESRITLRHGLKNAALPVVTVLGLRVAGLLGGTVAVETVFGLHGVGTMVVTAALGRDYTVLLASVTVLTVAVVLINTVVDVSYSYLNPRSR